MRLSGSLVSKGVYLADIISPLCSMNWHSFDKDCRADFVVHFIAILVTPTLFEAIKIDQTQGA